MRAILLLFLVALVVSDELPRKYMALRGFDIEGNDIKDTGNKNVRIGETVNGVDELKMICQNTEGCVAFTEEGVLKSATKPLKRSSSTNTWIWTEGTNGCGG